MSLKSFDFYFNNINSKFLNHDFDIKKYNFVKNSIVNDNCEIDDYLNINCEGCENCYNCFNCKYCRNCRNCIDCDDCDDLNEIIGYHQNMREINASIIFYKCAILTMMIFYSSLVIIGLGLLIIITIYYLI